MTGSAFGFGANAKVMPLTIIGRSCRLGGLGADVADWFV
jgi:hypothetical protein